MKSEILRLLKSEEGYLSGQELCNRLQVSRTAIWKVMNQLKEEGYRIDSVSNRGYHLESCPDIITKEELESEMTGKKFGHQVFYEEELDSTNVQAKRLAEQGLADHGCLVTTEKQTSGKGRRGRSWSSPKGSGIWMSLVLKPDISPYNASMLTLVTALAVNRAVREETDLESYIKWPNDIVINGKKLCGILTEMSSEPDYIHYVVIGIGINVNTKYFSEEISKKATSLFMESNKTYRRSLIIKKILEYLEFYYEQFLLNQDMRPLMTEYNQMLINIENKVVVQEKQTLFEGIAKGINEKGELLVQTKKGLRTVMSGEVSVRGIYGYV